jgi:hypothetical protein
MKIRKHEMKKIILTLIFISGSYLKCLSQTVVVDGHAFLEGTLVYDGIQIIFERTIPSVFYDTAYTDLSGYFNDTIPTGIYNIHYNKQDYLPVNVNGNALYNNTTLNDTTLETAGLQGSLSGVLTTGTYKIGNDIQVAFGDTLIIEPGTILRFKPNLTFNISGLLISAGTITDSIFFTSYYDSLIWDGINFRDSSNDNSILSYSVITNSLNGLSINNSSPDLNNLSITKNQSALFVNAASTVRINNLKIIDNTNSVNIARSTAGASLISGNGTDTIFLESSIIDHNIQSQNSLAGGIWAGGVILIINNTIISNNTGASGGIFFDSSPGLLKVTNSLIDGNESINTQLGAGGIYYNGWENPADIYNTIVSNNSAQTGQCGGVWCRITDPPEIRFSDLWNNTPSDFCYDTTNFVGLILTTNSNGDSCDAYSNFFLDPDFQTASYYLSTNSPCIDAGSNLYVNSNTDLENNPRIFDGDNNTTLIVDIGPYEYNGTQVSTENITLQKSSVVYPNPLHSEAKIILDNYSGSNENKKYSLVIYNSLGEQICEEENSNSPSFLLKRNFLPDGLFFYKILSEYKTISSGKFIIE